MKNFRFFFQHAFATWGKWALGFLTATIVWYFDMIEAHPGVIIFAVLGFWLGLASIVNGWFGIGKRKEG